MISTEQRVRRLLRCYPRAWRERYGEEFAALLADDIGERPRSLRRDVDVIRAGVVARLARCGIVHGPLRSQSAAAFVGTAAAGLFVACTVSIWTQLAGGWLTASPDTAAVSVGLVTLSGWLAGLLLTAIVAGVRVAAAVVRSARAGRGADLLRPLQLFVTSGAILVAGARLIAPRWPAGRATHDNGMIVDFARTGWAATDAISTFWLHPHRLLAVPIGELAWMVLSPVAVVALVWAAIRVVQVSGPRLVRNSGKAWAVAGAFVLPCFVTAAAWVLGSQHAANPAFRAGTLDVVLLGVMATATLVVRRASVSS
jgi:hypothetical protein